MRSRELPETLVWVLMFDCRLQLVKLHRAAELCTVADEEDRSEDERIASRSVADDKGAEVGWKAACPAEECDLEACVHNRTKSSRLQLQPRRCLLTLRPCHRWDVAEEVQHVYAGTSGLYDLPCTSASTTAPK